MPKRATKATVENRGVIMLTESWLRLKIGVERRARRSTCGLLDESKKGTAKKSKNINKRLA